MKKLICLVLCMAVLVLAGCTKTTDTPTAQTTDPSVETTQEDSSAIHVTNVDELLAAIAPGAEIIMEPGDYVLSASHDYGRRNTGSYYVWESSYDNECRLLIHNVDNLTIRGSGADKTHLLTEPRSVDVLSLENCTNVTLSDIDLGHTVMAEVCDGGVIRMDNCSVIRLSNLSLYGCGTYGLWLNTCRNVQVADSDIHDCSSSGIYMFDSDSVTVERSRIRNIGKNDMGYQGLYINNCLDVTFADCQFSENYLYNLIAVWECPNLQIQGCTINANSFLAPAFELQLSQTTMSGCIIGDNQLRRWYTEESDHILDENGQEYVLPEIEPIQETPNDTSWREQMAQQDRKQVVVNTVDELIAAIAPNTEIVLNDKLYDLSLAAGYGSEFSEYYYWSDEYEGYTLVIRDVDNLKIVSEDGNRAAHMVVAEPRYADVIRLENCTNVELSGFTAGHTVEPGFCTGDVLELYSCRNIVVDNCGLYGCGEIGINASFCSNLIVEKSEIYECSWFGLHLYECMHVDVNETVLRDLPNESSYTNCYYVFVDGQAIESKFAAG